MKYPTIVCCLFSLAIAGRETQVQLEDIEKDNLANERSLKQGIEPAKAAGPASVQLQYGFVPMKNQPAYASQAQQPQHQQQQYQLQYQYQPQYTPSNPQNYNVQYVQQQPQPTPYYPTKAQYTSTSQGYTTQFVQPQYQTQQSQYQTQQPQYQTQQPQYQTQQLQYQTQQPQYQTQQPQQPQRNAFFASKYDNLQNLIDNHLQSYLTQPQHATTPQYVYVQPNQASTNNIHTVVDSKGNLQYYTYLPLSEIAGSNFVESDLTSAQTYISSIPQTIPTKPAPAQNNVQYQYVQYEQPQTKQNTQSKTKTPKFTNVQYYPQNQIQQQNQATLEFNYPEKRQPQSLLESYVPSILQYQYYKQQQAKLQQPLKTVSSDVTAGKSVAVKQQQQYVPAQQEITSQKQPQQTNYQN